MRTSAALSRLIRRVLYVYFAMFRLVYSISALVQLTPCVSRVLKNLARHADGMGRSGSTSSKVAELICKI